MLMGKIQLVSGIIVVSIMTAGLLIADRSVFAGRAENGINGRPVPTPGTTDKKSFAEYHGISIGTIAEDLRKKLGAPKDKSDAQDFYVFSDSESAQFYYDDAHKLTAIMITYTGDLKSAPTPLQVLGEDVPPNPNGGISKMVRFPKDGYWISYNRGSGSDAMLSIAIQKM